MTDAEGFDDAADDRRGGRKIGGVDDELSRAARRAPAGRHLRVGEGDQVRPPPLRTFRRSRRDIAVQDVAGVLSLYDGISDVVGPGGAAALPPLPVGVADLAALYLDDANPDAGPNDDEIRLEVVAALFQLKRVE